MRIPRRLIVLATAAALPGFIGCGTKPATPDGEPGKAEETSAKGSPEAAFKKVRDGLRSRDFGAIHDMLSKGAKAKAEAAMAKTAESAAAMGSLAKELLGFDPAELGGLPARDRFARIMNAAYAANESLGSALRSGGRDAGLAGGEVADAKADGDRATVTVKLLSGVEKAVDLVLEEGAWKLAEPLTSPTDGSPGPVGDEADAPQVRDPSKGAKPDAKLKP